MMHVGTKVLINKKMKRGMFMSTTEMSLADIALVTRGNCNGGFLGGCNGNGIIDLAALSLFTGGGIFGNRERCATQEDVASGFNFAGVNGALKDLAAGQAGLNQNLSNAICQIGYQSLEQSSGLGSKIDNGNYMTLMALKDLTATVTAEGSATRTMMLEQENNNLRQNDLKNYVDKALCGIPRVSNAAWGVYPLTCQPSCTNI